jgi:hypothetical protein
MPVNASSPINRPTKRPEQGLSPGAKSMPGAKGDGGETFPAPALKPTGTDAKPEPSRADGGLSAVEAHLLHHRILPIGKGSTSPSFAFTCPDTD